MIGKSHGRRRKSRGKRTDGEGSPIAAGARQAGSEAGWIKRSREHCDAVYKKVFSVPGVMIDLIRSGLAVDTRGVACCARRSPCLPLGYG